MTCALVDCNNFYASCEQLFQPQLRGRPLVVLSNNDGCVVARSAEAKALGIGMAVPWHQLADLARRHRVVALSSNYVLYADLSARVMQVLSAFSPRQEVYSIDECFLDLGGAHHDPLAISRRLRQEVARLVGLPVSVGLGTTKTLAKLANHLAKKRPQYDGVCTLEGLSSAALEALLGSIPVGEVWGVGPRLQQRLTAEGIGTALALRRVDPERIRVRYSRALERTVRELRGELCHGFLQGGAPRQQILSSRSFGALIADLAPLEEAVTAYVTRAAEKLRAQGSVAGAVGVFLRTNPHRTDLPQYAPSRQQPLAPTADSRLLAATASALLQQLYRSGYRYQKAGVVLTELQPAATAQAGLFDDPAATVRSQALMAALDRINGTMGRGTVRLLGEGDDPRWAMRVSHRSPRFTTCLAELPQARAD